MQTKTILLIGILLLALPTFTIASESSSVKKFESFYVGANIGTSYNDDLCDGTISCEDTDTGFKIYAGYQFTDIFGIEAFYTDLGEFSASAYIYPTTVSINASASGLGAVATASIPIGDSVALFAKAGFMYWSVDVSASAGPYHISRNDDGVGFTAGLGARYSFTDKFGLRIDWDRYHVGDDNTTGETNIDLFSAGAFLSF